MDLKTYAVHRKLKYDDDLLSYVVNGDPIPVSVIEASFRDFIAPLADKKSERLIQDYPGMLANEVPVVVSKNKETGGYDVSGDIPDTLVDAITTVHHITPDDVVATLVDYNLETVHGQTCRILGTSLVERAERTMMGALAIPDVVSVQEILEQGEETGFEEPDAEAPSYTGASLEESSRQLQSTIAELDALEKELEESFEAVATNSTPDFLETAEAGDGLTEDIGEDAEVDLSDIDLDAMASDLLGEEPSEGFDGGDALEGAAEESEAPVEMEEAQAGGGQIDVAAACRRIYDKLCSDIREYGLDTRLNLVM